MAELRYAEPQVRYSPQFLAISPNGDPRVFVVRDAVSRQRSMPVAPMPNAESPVETELLAGNIVLTHMRGTVTRASAEERFDQFRTRLGFLREPRWIINQEGMKGFEPSAIAAGRHWFNLFRERGGHELVIVSKIPGARMAGASLAFSVRINVQVVTSLDEAFAHFDVKRPVRA